MKIAIVGAGLAGLSAAYFLNQNGTHCSVFDFSAKIASGASGNDAGLYNPRFFASYDFEAEFYARSFELIVPFFERYADEIDHKKCGALHLINTDQKKKRYPKMCASWPWDEQDLKLVSVEEGAKISGASLDYDGLFLPRSGIVSPKKLCGLYQSLSGCDVQLGQNITDLDDLYDAFDVVILACAVQAKLLWRGFDLPLKPVRGQVTKIQSHAPMSDLKTVLCYGGYSTVGCGRFHVVGSSFDRGVGTSHVQDQDDLDNLEKLFTAVPSLRHDYTKIDARASVRTTAPDHFPVIGRLDDRTFISTAHGSHGILSSFMGAQILSHMITGSDCPVRAGVIDRLDPYRFSAPMDKVGA